MYSYFKIKKQKKSYKATKAYMTILKRTIDQSYFYPSFFSLNLHDQFIFIQKTIIFFGNFEISTRKINRNNLSKLLDPEITRYVLKKIYERFMRNREEYMIKETLKRRPDLKQFLSK